MNEYDAIIIGAGQAGGPLSTALARAGWKTAIIERVHVGGTCINEGCTPTKTMVASARVAYLARRAADYGVHTGPVTVDMTVVRQRKRDIVESFRNGSQQRIESTEGVDLVMGEARFTGPKLVEVRLTNGETRQLTAGTIFLNTGDRPSKPHLNGLDRVSALDSTSIMELDIVPEHLLVIGGGYVGLETTPVQVEQLAGGAIQLTVHTPAGERTLNGSHLLLAAGRVPNSDWLNLAAVGVQVDKRGSIQVNERLETNVPGIYALGDVKGGPAFTHISYDDFRI